jgi:hypothetical protein
MPVSSTHTACAQCVDKHALSEVEGHALSEVDKHALSEVEWLSTSGVRFDCTVLFPARPEP